MSGVPNAVVDLISDLLVTGDLFKKGSEAYLYLGTFLGVPVVIKERKAKKYRHPDLDTALRTDRTRLEARIMIDAQNLGLPVASLLGAIPEKNILIMEFIAGETMGKILMQNPGPSDPSINSWFAFLGQTTAKLHTNGIVHGDLSIYNTLISEDGEIHLIDFGLSFRSTELEHLAGDLFTFEKTLNAFDPGQADKWFKNFISSYCKEYSKSENVIGQYDKIMARGRYKRQEVDFEE